MKSTSVRNNTMSFTKITCKAGHRINAPARLAGKTLPCPKCGVGVTIPKPEHNDKLSDTAVLRILGDAPVAITEHVQPADESGTRKCPRCEVRMGWYLTVCPLCQCYAGPVADYWHKMLGDNAPQNRETA
jgi:hypothetical protein